MNLKIGIRQEHDGWYWDLTTATSVGVVTYKGLVPYTTEAGAQLGAQRQLNALDALIERRPRWSTSS